MGDFLGLKEEKIIKNKRIPELYFNFRKIYPILILNLVNKRKIRRFSA